MRKNKNGRQKYEKNKNGRQKYEKRNLITFELNIFLFT